MGELDSALNWPINKFTHAAEDSFGLFDLAAAYASGLARDHAFNDADKRTARACCVLSLRVNGVELDVPTMEIVTRVLGHFPRSLARE